MIALLSSLVALLAAPLLDRAVHEAPRVALVVDMLVRGLVGAIVLLHVLPEAWHLSGLLAPAALAAGWALPLAVERLPAIAHVRDQAAVAFAATGLAVHSLLDGAGLAQGHGPVRFLPLAIVLHTVPVGVISWRGVRAVAGDGPAFGVLLVAALATVLGYAGAASVDAAGSALVLFQCLVGGTLLHVLSHHEPEHGHDHAPRDREPR